MTPKIIVLTPVRNEAWILRAFLTATSLWADHIIIADQMSDDGSRDIYKDFPKVTLIDNNRKEMHQAATRRLLFEEAHRMLGNNDAILLALDADEILCGDFLHSKAWQTILNSQPNDTFCWRWMYLKGGDPTQYSTSNLQYWYWGVHVSESFWQGMFPDNFIHEWRLPWPDECTKEKTLMLDDLFSIHFAHMNVARSENKIRFYQVSSLHGRINNETRKYTSYALYRQYHGSGNAEYAPLPDNAFSYYQQHNIDLWQLVDLNDEGEHMTKAILNFFVQDGIKRYANLDIWDREWCLRHKITPP
ncbi:MAG: glycosyltransferase family 2 protein [Bacteroidales bacterium]|nr:glycosyltransferase family 2 protein [Bacteroidales bacterium]